MVIFVAIIQEIITPFKASKYFLSPCELLRWIKNMNSVWTAKLDKLFMDMLTFSPTIKQPGYEAVH